MDTFYVKVDMGSIIAQQMHLCRARNIITDIGFGNATLYFSNVPTTSGRVDATVGAGNLEVLIPRKNAPVIIYINDSPLCGIKLAKDFKEVDDNIYVNKDYSPDALNLLTFNIDVALGNVIFKYSDSR